MSATAVINVWGAPSAEAVARAAAEAARAEPVLQQYWGSAAGIWTLSLPDGVVSVHDAAEAEAEAEAEGDAAGPPVWVDVYRPGDGAEQQRLAVQVFDCLAASTAWCIVLDVDGLPQRTSGC